MAEWELVAKRERIRFAEERMDYFSKMMTQRPQLYGIWFYWFNWWRVQRADWQTRLWLEELRGWKAEIRSWPKPEEHLDRAETIRKNVETVEDGIVVIRRELKLTRREARTRDWHVRFPRPYATMTRWITTITRRFRRIHYWIKLIREELPVQWKQFVYVIYYAYTLPGAERHLEAHLEGQCHVAEAVQERVKKIANKLLREWVAKMKYAVPLLTSGMEKPPYKGAKTAGESRWEWGVQWHKRLEQAKLVQAPTKIESKEEQVLVFELYDYDFNVFRQYDYFMVPAVFWEMSQDDLEKRLQIGKYTPTEEEE